MEYVESTAIFILIAIWYFERVIFIKKTKKKYHKPKNIRESGKKTTPNQPSINAKEKLVHQLVENSVHENLGEPDAEQMSILRYLLSHNKNVFITGGAGTGKSFLLKVYRKVTTERVIVVAPTGVAAENVSPAATIHRQFGYKNIEMIDISELNNETLIMHESKKHALKMADVIIVDEVSMVNPLVFDKMNKILQIICESNKQFGGKRVILFGDLFQLQPVVTTQELMMYLKDHYEGKLIVDSFSYKNGNFELIELKTNHRQKTDKKYFELLNHIRDKSISQLELEYINSRYVKEGDITKDFIIYLTAKSAEAEKINNKRIKMLPGPDYEYIAEVKFKKEDISLEKVFNDLTIQQKLVIRKGCIVMLKINDPVQGWTNGTLARVIECYKTHIKVQLQNGYNFDIYPAKFELNEYTYKKGKLTAEVVARVYQIPLIPGFAITIHKSQSKTFEKIECNCESCFDYGHVYTALSRGQSLEGIYLKYKLNWNDIKVDQRVIDFYKNSKRLKIENM